MFEDLTLYAMLAALIIFVSAPTWLLIVPAVAALSATARHLKRGS